MKLALGIIGLLVFIFTFSFGYAYSAGSVYDEVFNKAKVSKNGVKEISYEELLKIKDSGENYVLLDVLSPESYNQGHIKGAESFPLDTIDEKTVEARLNKDLRIIVYCGGFKCKASTNASKKLSSLEYKVLDYKGGLEEWQDKGNALVRDQVG